MRILKVRHLTTYSYAKPVRLGEHRLMLRPRDSHDLRIVGTMLEIVPLPVSIRWLHDVFENSVAIAAFDVAATELRITSEIEVELYERTGPDYAIEHYAETYPFSYARDEVPDLIRSVERHYADPEHRVDLWVKEFIDSGPTSTLALLGAVTRAIQDRFKYVVRYEAGIQTPVETLAMGSGSCRDFAVLMMEAARALGLAARFVSGYLHVPAAAPGGGQAIALDGGATHAWVQIYLPGSGWTEFDPTNGVVGNHDLIRVAVVRDPAQAVPISGAWTGAPTDYLGMSVEVGVTVR